MCKQLQSLGEEQESTLLTRKYKHSRVTAADHPGNDGESSLAWLMKRSARPQTNTLDSWLVKRQRTDTPVEGVALNAVQTDQAARITEETVTTTTTTTTTTTRKFQPVASAQVVTPVAHVDSQPEPQGDDRPYMAIIYEGILEGVPEDHPLCGISYVGQAVRLLYKHPTPEALLKTRSREHVSDTLHHPKQIGIRAIIKRFGEGSISWRVVESNIQPSVEASVWADEREVHHIAERGGVVKDMEPTERLRQTFNIMPGGKCNSEKSAQDYWDAIQARKKAIQDRTLRALREFKAEHGHMRVRGGYTCFSDGDREFPLGMRVSTIRSGHTDNGSEEEPTPFRIALDALGFIWNADEHDRQRVLMALREFKEKNGHMRVRQGYTCLSDGDREFPLGMRVSTIRSGNTNTGTEEEPTPFRVELDALGFIWDADEHERQRVLTALREFKAKNGHMRVRQDYTCLNDGDPNFPLGIRVGTIRISHVDTGSEEDPTPYRIALDALGFIWDAYEHDRQRVLTALREFKAKNGHMRVKHTYTCFSDGDAEFTLGARVKVIRSARADTGTETSPTLYRIALDALGFIWDPEEHDRQRVLTALREFKEENGHMRVKRDYTCFSDGDPRFQLGARVGNIRAGRIITGTEEEPTPFRIALNALGFIWDAE